MLGKFSYLQYIIPFWIMLVIAITFYPRIIRLILLNKKIVLRGMLVAFIVMFLGQYIALSSKIWVFPIEKRLGIEFLSMPIEDLLLNPLLGFCLLILPLIFIDLEEKKVSMLVWFKTILGLSSLGLVTIGLVLLLQFLKGY